MYFIACICFYLAYKLYRWSNISRKDAEHWSDIKHSNLGTKAYANYVIMFVLSITFAFAGIGLCVLAL